MLELPLDFNGGNVEANEAHLLVRQRRELAAR